MRLGRTLQPMRCVLILLCLTATGVSALSAPRHKTEKITGRVVAYSTGQSCLNGNGYWSMVIHTQPDKHQPPEFLRIDFSLPCSKTPDFASSAPPVQTFHLIRRRDCDAKLEGTMATDEKLLAIDKRSTAEANGIKEILILPLWSRPPGMGSFPLPFGQIVPCYRSLDLPLVPVL